MTGCTRVGFQCISGGIANCAQFTTSESQCHYKHGIANGTISL
jgi:hypothetical protein